MTKKSSAQIILNGISAMKKALPIVLDHESKLPTIETPSNVTACYHLQLSEYMKNFINSGHEAVIDLLLSEDDIDECEY